jgi:hypothetical protein
VNKVDLYKLHKSEYVAPKKPAIIECKPAQYLAIDGQGEPGGGEFQNAIGALYNVAFTIKMSKKKSAGQDYAVSKLEGLFAKREKWTLLIRTPDFITAADLRTAQKGLEEKGKGPEVARVRFEKLKEGKCAQVLYVGPYPGISTAINALHEFAQGQKLRVEGLHHEIYLSDPRRVEPAKLKTILRAPVR